MQAHGGLRFTLHLTSKIFIGFLEMLLFILLLLVGYVYAWKKGVLQWEK